MKKISRKQDIREDDATVKVPKIQISGKIPYHMSVFIYKSWIFQNPSQVTERLESSLLEQPFNEAIQDSDWSDSDQSDGIPQMSSDGTPDIDETDALSRKDDGSKLFKTADGATSKKIMNSKGRDPRTVYKIIYRPLNLC